VRRASRRLGAAGVLALPLVLAAWAGAAPSKSAPSPDTTAAPAAPAPWIGDELRVLRSEVETLKQRADGSAADLSALRAELSKLTAAQGEAERRLSSPPATTSPVGQPDRGGGGAAAAAVFLTLGAALGWVGSRLTQRWRDRRQRLRV
jgi:hypothetical protein